MKKFYLVLSFFALISGCASHNYNPGQNRADAAWLSGRFHYAYNLVKPVAQAGQPWAQLRLGIFYENGWGTKKNIFEAEAWYIKTMHHKAVDPRPNGQTNNTTSERGFINYKNNTIIAKYKLAHLYYNNNKDLNKAYHLINNVLTESSGKAIFFCCEFDKSRYFTQNMFINLRNHIHKKIHGTVPTQPIQQYIKNDNKPYNEKKPKNLILTNFGRI